MVEKYLSRSKHTWAYAVLFYRHSSLVYVWETHTLYITYTTHHTRTLYAEASHYFFFSLYFPVFKLITITFCNGIKKKNHWKLKIAVPSTNSRWKLLFQNVVCTHHQIWLGFFSKMFPFLKTRWMSFQYENLLQSRNTQQPLEDLFLTLCLKGLHRPTLKSDNGRLKASNCLIVNSLDTSCYQTCVMIHKLILSYLRHFSLIK